MKIDRSRLSPEELKLADIACRHWRRDDERHVWIEVNIEDEPLQAAPTCLLSDRIERLWDMLLWWPMILTTRLPRGWPRIVASALVLPLLLPGVLMALPFMLAQGLAEMWEQRK